MPYEQDSEALFIRLYLDEDVFKSLAPALINSPDWMPLFAATTPHDEPTARSARR